MYTYLLHRAAPKDAAANCGVYIGISYNEYIGMAAAAAGVSPYTATGGSLSVAAGLCDPVTPQDDVSDTADGFSCCMLSLGPRLSVAAYVF